MNKQPIPFNALIACGHSPQVITETLYLLLNDPAQPRELRKLFILTTVEGSHCIRRLLLGDESVACENSNLDARYKTLETRWERFWEVLGRAPVPLDEIVVPALLLEDGTEGGLIEDIRTPAADEAFADACFDLVKELVGPEHEDTQLIVSIAGGRKTMSSHMHNALSVFGRPTQTLSSGQRRPADRLLHVLYEHEKDYSNFFFPGDSSGAPIEGLQLVNVGYLRLTPLLSHEAAVALRDPRIPMRFKYRLLLNALAEEDVDLVKELAKWKVLQMVLTVDLGSGETTVQFIDRAGEVHFKSGLYQRQSSFLLVALASSDGLMMKESNVLVDPGNNQEFLERAEIFEARQTLYRLIKNNPQIELKRGDKGGEWWGVELSAVRDSLIEKASLPDNEDDTRDFLKFRFTWKKRPNQGWQWQEVFPQVEIVIVNRTDPGSPRFREEDWHALFQADSFKTPLAVTVK